MPVDILGREKLKKKFKNFYNTHEGALVNPPDSYEPHTEKPVFRYSLVVGLKNRNARWGSCMLNEHLGSTN